MDALKKIIQEIAKDIRAKKEIDEESTSCDVGHIQTSRAFVGGKKKKLKESDYNKASQYGAPSQYGAASGYTGVGGDNRPNEYYRDSYSFVSTRVSDEESPLQEGEVGIEVPENVENEINRLGYKIEDLGNKDIRIKLYNNEIVGPWIQQVLMPKLKNMNEAKLAHIIVKELINEVSYGQFKKEISYRTKTETLHKGIKEVKRKIQEIDRLVEYTSRIKSELNEGDGVQYWERTKASISQISEMVENLNNKIKTLT